MWLYEEEMSSEGKLRGRLGDARIRSRGGGGDGNTNEQAGRQVTSRWETTRKRANTYRELVEDEEKEKQGRGSRNR